MWCVLLFLLISLFSIRLYIWLRTYNVKLLINNGIEGGIEDCITKGERVHHKTMLLVINFVHRNLVRTLISCGVDDSILQANYLDQIQELLG